MWHHPRLPRYKLDGVWKESHIISHHVGWEVVSLHEIAYIGKITNKNILSNTSAFLGDGKGGLLYWHAVINRSIDRKITWRPGMA